MEAVRPILSNSVTPTAPNFSSNYMQRIVELVARSLALQNRSKTNERLQIEELKKKYENFSKISGDKSVAMGQHVFWGAMVSLGMMVGSQYTHLLPDALQQTMTPDMFKFFGEQGCKALTEVMNGRTMAEQKKADSVAALSINEYQSKTGNQNSNSNQEAINLVNQVIEAQKRASAS